MQEGLTELNLQLSRKLFLLRDRPYGNSQSQVQLRLQRITLGLKLKISSLLDQLLSWLASPSTRQTTKRHGQRGMTDYSASTFLRISFLQLTLTSIPISGDFLQFQYPHSHSQAGNKGRGRLPSSISYPLGMTQSKRVSWQNESILAGRLAGTITNQAGYSQGIADSIARSPTPISHLELLEFLPSAPPAHGNLRSTIARSSSIALSQVNGELFTCRQGLTVQHASQLEVFQKGIFIERWVLQRKRKFKGQSKQGSFSHG